MKIEQVNYEQGERVDQYIDDRRTPRRHREDDEVTVTVRMTMTLEEAEALRRLVAQHWGQDMGPVPTSEEDMLRSNSGGAIGESPAPRRLGRGSR